jgi:hypothetical protein
MLYVMCYGLEYAVCRVFEVVQIITFHCHYGWGLVR